MGDKGPESFDSTWPSRLSGNKLWALTRMWGIHIYTKHHFTSISSLLSDCPLGDWWQLTRSNTQVVVLILGAILIVIGIELNNTRRVLRNSDTNEGRVSLALSSTKTVSILVLDLAWFGVTSERGLAAELALFGPAISAESELASIAGVVARRVVGRVCLAVDGSAVVLEDGEAGTVTALASAAWSGDSWEVALGPDNAKMLGCDGGWKWGGQKAEENVMGRRHIDTRLESVWFDGFVKTEQWFWLIRDMERWIATYIYTRSLHCSRELHSVIPKLESPVNSLAIPHEWHHIERVNVAFRILRRGILTAWCCL